MNYIRGLISCLECPWKCHASLDSITKRKGTQWPDTGEASSPRAVCNAAPFQPLKDEASSGLTAQGEG
ncbi:unnamed protein product [Boreogadus saida]